MNDACGEEICAGIVERLRARWCAEIEQAAYAHIQDAVPEPISRKDTEYQAGLQAAVTAVFDYSLKGIERGPEWSEPIPPLAAAQARRAARAGVSMGIVLRRYVAGHEWLEEFIAEEVERSGHSNHGSVLRHLRRTQKALLKHLTAAIEREYEHERECVARSPEQRCAKLVQRLLVEDVDPAELKELDYDVGTSWHLGVIANGVEGAEILRDLKLARGQKLLLVSGDDGAVWAWLGSKAKLTIAEFKRLLSANGYPNPPLAIGEPGGGLQGWRQTHDEAQVAAPITRHELSGLTRCVDALPIVGALQNEALIRMYEKTYILPLNRLRKGGQPARKVLLAYCKHGRNASSAGDAINASRRTVENHINDARKVLGDPLNLTALEIALWLEQLGYMAEARDGVPMK